MTDQFGNETIEDVSEAFNLLRNARRRGVLYVLRQKGQTGVKTLARRISAWQSGEGERAPDSADVEMSLVHSHLPKLQAADVVEYDREAGTVELAESARNLDPLLRCTREREPGFSTGVTLQMSNV
ncbi:DUF7344 domain-containing protein [Halorussus lipolyticus]|uniref:DUF7344 domain-containing protein n=1 Tax=Halorussus lipolyticus TaxID=3034024 RepID=UPI0023E868D4|nr:hypothetical protein [Halorussus sp. DT80]